MIIDSHLHLDVNVDGTAAGAAYALDQQLEKAGIARAIVLHLETQPWTAQEFSAALAPYHRLNGFINVHPHHPSAITDFVNGIEQLGFTGLKLHPRLQEFSLSTKETIELVNVAGEMDVPVLIDAFPDGTHLMQGFSPLTYASLAKKCSNTRIIWAHFGGHYVLDFMMLAKRLPNVYIDFSYSLLYYQNSPVVDNIIYAMRSMKFERIFYGSDYPDRPIGISLEQSLAILHDKGVNGTNLESIMGANAIKFFKWKDL